MRQRLAAMLLLVFAAGAAACGKRIFKLDEGGKKPASAPASAPGTDTPKPEPARNWDAAGCTAAGGRYGEMSGDCFCKTPWSELKVRPGDECRGGFIVFNGARRVALALGEGKAADPAASELASKLPDCQSDDRFLRFSNDKRGLVCLAAGKHCVAFDPEAPKHVPCAEVEASRPFRLYREMLAWEKTPFCGDDAEAGEGTVSKTDAGGVAHAVCRASYSGPSSLCQEEDADGSLTGPHPCEDQDANPFDLINW